MSYLIKEMWDRKHKILLVDDHRIVLRGLSNLIKTNFPGAQIFEANDSNSALSMLQKDHYDLIILDVKLPDSNPIQFLDFLILKYPQLNVLIYSMFPEKIIAQRMYKNGAKGYLCKDHEPGVILEAITTVLNGKIFFSESYKELLNQRLINDVTDNIFEKLTDRELEVALLLARGKNLMYIQKSLNIHKSTASTFKSRIFMKLEVENIVELSELCSTHGFL